MQNHLLYNCQGKKVYCYGAGKYGRIVAAYLLEHSITISGFLVTDKKNVDSNVLNFPVYEFSADLLTDNYIILITAGKKNANEIVKRLEALKNIFYLYISEEQLNNIGDNLSFVNYLHVQKNINILFYHRVNILPIDTWKLCISPKSFEAHVKFLKSNYNIVRFEDAWKNIQEKSIVLTFDDGYADFYEYALPILEKHRIPATVFISTGNIDTNKEFWWDELENIIFNGKYKDNNIYYNDVLLNVGDHSQKDVTCHKIRSFLKSLPCERRECELVMLRKIFNADGVESRAVNRTLNTEEILTLSRSPYITIGAHTVTHTSLAIETLERQHWELAHSKATLKKIIGRDVTEFAYPFGENIDYTEKTKKIAIECGYKLIATTNAGLNDGKADTFSLNRNGVGIWDIETLKQRLEYSYLIYG